MKVSIPLDSTLSTDSHNNDIKDPARDRDLFNNNRAYYYNQHLTNARKKEVGASGYITTNGQVLNIAENGSTTVITNKDGLHIASVSSLGIENEEFYDRDDAVVDGGYLWLIKKTAEGYIVEKISLQTQNKETLEEVKPPKTTEGFFQYEYADVRFIKNTHKVITRNTDGSIDIDGINYRGSTPDPDNPGRWLWGDVDMQNYFSTFSGEFSAVEIDGRIIFGYNNPKGVPRQEPGNEIIINLDPNAAGFDLEPYVWANNIDTSIPQKFVINVPAGARIGRQRGQAPFAITMQLSTENNNLHSVELNLGTNAIISGDGGDGGHFDGNINFPFITNGRQGCIALLTRINTVINGQSGSIIQGGGGGGGAIIFGATETYFVTNGGGGAGLPGGRGNLESNANQATVIAGADGTASLGGGGGYIFINVNWEFLGGSGGNPGQSGTLAQALRATNPGVHWSQPGIAGEAMFVLDGASCVVNGVTVIGEVIRRS